MNTLRTATFLVVVALSSSSVLQTPAAKDTFELLILHNNDMHARFEQTSQLSGTCTTVDRDAGKCYGGFPRVATVVKEARKAAASGEGPPVLYLNAGDTYTGTAWFSIYKWKIAAEFLNALQPDAVSLGNHEFDNGISGLTPFIKNLTCPVLAANLILAKVPELESEPNLMKSVIFDINGTKVGVIGYLTPETAVLAVRNDVEYVEEVIAIREEAASLKRKGIDILIALGHSGFTKDLQIAKEVEDIDLVIGGHTNTFLWNGTSPDAEKPEGPYPMLVKQFSGKIVPAVQAYAYTKYLGKLHLVFNSSGDLLSLNGNPILLDVNIPQDTEVLEIVNHYSNDIKKITDLVVGKTSVILDSHSCRLEECNMGNLITDAMIYNYALDYTGTGWTDIPISVVQGGGIRASINKHNLPANITKGDLLTVMPFEGSLVVLKLSGTEIWEMLEHAVAFYNTRRPPGQFLQFSGIKVEYDFSKKPWKRVTKVVVRCGLCDVPTYIALNRSETYNILMPSFLSNGGDGFTMLSNKSSISLNYNELDCTIKYIKNNSPVFPGIEQRIIINNLNRLSNSAKTYGSSFLIMILLVIKHFVIRF